MPHRPTSPRWPGAIATLIAWCGLLAFAISRAWNRGQWLDLHSEDEVIYLQLGQQLMTAGEWPDTAFSPIYCVLAYLVSLVTPATAVPADLIYWLLLLLGTVTMVWALTPLTRFLAVPLTAWWVALPFVTQGSVISSAALPNVYLFGQCHTLLVLGMLTRERYRTALLLLALVPLSRPDAITWLAAIPVLALVLGVHRRFGRAWPGYVVVAVAWTIGILQPSLQQRSWLAFQQHYARHATVARMQQKYGVREGDPVPQEVALAAWLEMEIAFIHPERVVEADFPGAHSLTGACLAQPGRFLAFVGTNLAATPDMIEHAMQPTGMPSWASRSLLGAAALAAAVGWWRRRRTIPRPASPAVAAAYCGLPACIFSMSWVAPRCELLAPLFPLLATTIGVGLVWLTPRRWWQCRMPRIALDAALGVTLLTIASLVPGPFSAPPTHRPAYREELLLIRDFDLPPGARVLCGSQRLFSTYTGHDAEWLDLDYLSPEQRQPDRLLRSERIDHVLVGLGLETLAPDIVAALQSGQYPDWLVTTELGRAKLWSRR